MSENPTSSAAADAKAYAEAGAASALSEFHAANSRKADAEARRADAEVEAFAQEARTRRAQADVAEITATVTRKEHLRSLAKDSENNIYRFAGAVTDDSVAKAMDNLSRWDRLHPGAPLELQFYSPGGSVLAGLALWDFLQELKSHGHVLTTVINGVAASMAGILSQAGDVRVIGKESWLMIHEISAGAQGKVGEIEDTVEWIKKVQERVKTIFAERSTLTVDDLEGIWRRKDAWIDSDNALRMGLVDEIR